jgi:hypothetical protein
MRVWGYVLALALGAFGSVGALAAPGDPAAGGAPAPAAAAGISLTVDDFSNRYTLTTQNADLAAVLAALAKASGWDVRLENVATRPVNLYRTNPPTGKDGLEKINTKESK